MCIKSIKYPLFLILLMPVYAHAQLVNEKEINEWGYKTLTYNSSTSKSYIFETQLIKSKKHAPGFKDYYYYYALSQICYSGYFAALKRKLSLLERDEKDYTLSDLSGKCVRTVNTAANFDTYKEQPRIFELFKAYLDKTHNKAVHVESKPPSK